MCICIFLPLTLTLIPPSAMPIFSVMSASVLAFLVAGNIDFVVPLIAHKIDRPPAGVILGTVPAPIFSVPGGYVQVNRGLDHAGRWRLDHNRSPINDLRLREVTDIDTAVKTRLTDADRYTDI